MSWNNSQWPLTAGFRSECSTDRELVEFVVTSDPYSELDGQETWNGFSDLAWYAGLSRFFFGAGNVCHDTRQAFIVSFLVSGCAAVGFVAIDVHW